MTHVDYLKVWGPKDTDLYVRALVDEEPPKVVVNMPEDMVSPAESAGTAANVTVSDDGEELSL